METVLLNKKCEDHDKRKKKNSLAHGLEAWVKPRSILLKSPHRFGIVSVQEVSLKEIYRCGLLIALKHQQSTQQSIESWRTVLFTAGLRQRIFQSRLHTINGHQTQYVFKVKVASLERLLICSHPAPPCSNDWQSFSHYCSHYNIAHGHHLQVLLSCTCSAFFLFLLNSINVFKLLSRTVISFSKSSSSTSSQINQSSEDIVQCIFRGRGREG